MATTKRGGQNQSGKDGGGSSAGAQPARGGKARIRSSHEGRAPKAKRRVARSVAPVPRAGPPAGLAPTRSARAQSGPAEVVAPKIPVSGGPRTRKARPQTVAAAAPSVASDEARELAIQIAVAGLDKKAVGLEILDVAGKVDYADFLVLMTGRSDRQVAALSQGIEEALRRKGRRPISVEGVQQATWILMDYGDVVVHVFQDDARSLYDIEGLWLDVRRIPVPLPEGLREAPPTEGKGPRWRGSKSLPA